MDERYATGGVDASTLCYRQVGRISDGGYGRVVKAKHRLTGQTVAIKTLREDHDDVRMLLREACFQAACRGHPNIVGLHGVVRNPRTGKYSLVMEYVGPSLADVLEDRVERRGRGYLEPVVRRTMRQLLRGAKAMHDRRIVHRDIKPGNILVGKDRGSVSVKICDFGLAMSTTEASPPYSQGGTYWYMAPEVLLRKPGYGEVADMWSLGCVIAELFSGKVLFEGDDAAHQLHKIFDVLGVPGKETLEAFKPKSKLLALEVEQWRSARQQQQPEQCANHHDRLRELIPEKLLSQDGFDILKGLLAFNPDERLTAAEALSHRWFAGADPDEGSALAAFLAMVAWLVFTAICAWVFVRVYTLWINFEA
uniref:Protein kinase domain-containing protein n=2 Tax=Oryza brachyantha TaxID=4533 RepID=J3MXX6_ORYBR